MRAGLLLAVALAPVVAHAADPFLKPTKEELEMKSLPGYPGAAAVVLFREEISKDDLHVFQNYNRIKILTEEGKKYANVELGFVSSSASAYMENGDDKMVGDIIGRTIHADGTIIPFTGKPYLKVIEKTKGYKVREKVFTLPDVEVGSIIEYRYSTRYNDYVYEAPDWYIQGDLYLKAAHYVWYPTGHEMTDGATGEAINSISWLPILPPGTELVHRDLPGTDAVGRVLRVYELNIKDVPPQTEEEFMPPIASFSYRVLFNFTPYRTPAEYWKSRGKVWSKSVDGFAGPNSDLRSATESIIAGANTQDEKLRKIYAAVMALENTSYTRAHEQREDKAEGLGKVSNASDVLSHKRGDSAQLTELFVGMARAAGMKAYMMLVPDRSSELFAPGRMSFSQFSDLIAIVNVDGKEQFFAPGSRYCPYARLPWEDTVAQGLRQVEGGTDFGHTTEENYKDNKTVRIANLKMDEHGGITGKINITFDGAPALHWRQQALQGDEESIKHSLRTSLEEMLPKTLEVKVSEIHGISDYEKPLTVDYEVKGTLGTPTGKRLVLPVDLFRAGSTATFTHEKRELAVYFHYPQMTQDALRINFPANFSIEGSPASSRVDMKGSGLYNMTVTPAPTNVTVRRDFIFNDLFVMPKNYPGLRSFYSQFEAKDQESIVLKVAPVEASTSAGPEVK
ncbi:DUF3857 domain-containing protein [Granulicella mallensis]|uniref:Transglutaminase domain-containing protein n=1 Tax=Granulicella mallensis TaxID=940614 RepID=A0A7W7ZVD5_9BACT|nr:DUF3857 domain-containing protein [Granulicella mallensis]MBB5066818.1 hypothetical protein [Granulicella mallensis]